MNELWLLIWWCCNPLPTTMIDNKYASRPRVEVFYTSSDTVKAIDLLAQNEDNKFCVIHEGKYCDVVLKHEEPTRLIEPAPKYGIVSLQLNGSTTEYNLRQ